jgi:hypothetical protein
MEDRVDIPEGAWRRCAIYAPMPPCGGTGIHGGHILSNLTNKRRANPEILSDRTGALRWCSKRRFASEFPKPPFQVKCTRRAAGRIEGGEEFYFAGWFCADTVFPGYFLSFFLS